MHFVSVQYLTKGGAVKRRVVRSRDFRFLDEATEPDDELDAASVSTAPLDEDDPVLADALDTLGRCATAPMPTNVRPLRHVSCPGRGCTDGPGAEGRR